MILVSTLELLEKDVARSVGVAVHYHATSRTLEGLGAELGVDVTASLSNL